MISPSHFNCVTYSEILSRLVNGEKLLCKRFGITLKTIGHDNLIVYTSSKKLFGLIKEKTFENMFSVTEDSIQTAIMTALSFQEDKGYFYDIKVVCYNSSPYGPFFVGDLKGAVSKLSQLRNLRPGDEIYLEPALKGSVRRFARELF